MEAAAEEKRAFKHMIWPGVLLGIWLVVSPFILNYTRVPVAMWNSIAVGVVVALTAYAMKGDEEKARAAGCDGYITKPIDTRKLPIQIREYLDSAPQHR